MFEPLPSKFDFPKSEEAVLEFWKVHDIFGKSLEQRKGAERFVFYEGPPTANGMPHPGHCLTRAMKDLFPRYQTMCGKLVERKAGWDTHGLPVEIEVCKELGIHTKEEIEAYGVENFVRKCVESVWRYTREWEYMTNRLGFWINLDEAYATYHQYYVESVWWSLKTLFDRGLLYQGHKVVWWWAQGGTALSAGEVGEGYREVDDPSVYVRFPLVEGQELPGVVAPASRRCSLLVWTTTPWTLISNHFAAVHPKLDYALVRDRETDEFFYIASGLVETISRKVKHEMETLATIKGTELVGLRYVPPFDCYYEKLTLEPGRWGPGPAPRMGVPLKEVQAPLSSRQLQHTGWRVLPAGFVTTESGTGVVHEAPAFGEVDFDLLQSERQRFQSPATAIPIICAVAPDGTFNNEAPEQYRGRWVKDCDKDIIRELKERGLLLHQEQIRHDYPFCPRAEDDPLIQYARKSWFVRTSKFKDEFLKNNDAVTWLPEHIKEGRFGDFLRNNVDWALSRERYWGTPLPIWVCEQTGRMEAIGCFDELTSKPGATDNGFWERMKSEHPEMPDDLRVHKPYIDEWTYESPFVKGSAGVSPARMNRVTEVIDCWWDAGSMPFAQWGYPHVDGSATTFEQRFPADFISEAIDQTRGWFYGLLAISTLLFSKGSAGVPPAQTNPSAKGRAGVPPARTHSGVLAEPVTEQLSIRKRHRLPHWEAGGSTYFLTLRVKEDELSQSERDTVLAACRHWDSQRILLHAAVVMPDHVHLLLTPLERSPGQWWSLADLMHSIKGFSAKAINADRSESGSVWQAEFFDRIIRNESDFEEKWNYIVNNPTVRGLPKDYAWVWVEGSHEVGVLKDDQKSCGRDARTPQAGVRSAYPLPYRACIVLGHMMGEDGLKMSKRTKNYKDPSYVFDHFGADAMRWYFFSAQAPWTNARFQENNIRDAQREFLVRLYNVLSFFNIYANIDGFGVERTGNGEREKGNGERGTGWRTVRERSELDRWIISELHRTIQSMRESLDRFENYPAACKLNEFVDGLSNWYVRRSRERFWCALESAKPGDECGTGVSPVREDTGGTPVPQDQDKWDAYNTLYEVLVSLSKLIAPFTPFFAETMYRNLAGIEGLREQGIEDRAISVHLCDYPVADDSLIDEQSAMEMAIVRELVSLGRSGRTAARLKVRQPLGRVEVILARPEHEQWLRRHQALIAEELNVRTVEFATDADRYVSYQIKANFQSIGPKFGKRAPRIAKALREIDAAAARKSLLESGTLTLELDGQAIELDDGDVQIRLEAKAGWSAAQGRSGVVVIKTELSPALIEEGLVRELIHHIQGLRKEHELPYEARVTVYLTAPDELRAVVERHAETLRRECLAERIVFEGDPRIDMGEFKVEPHTVGLGIATI